MSRESKKKLDPRIYVGICSGLGYLGVAAYKISMFGWDDVPAFWIWSGAGLIGAMAMVGALHFFHDRRRLKSAIARSSRQTDLRRARGEPDASGTDRSAAVDTSLD